MKTCKSCRYSFSIFDHEYYPVLMCRPKNNKNEEQIAVAICENYERCAGCDENEDK